MWLRVAQLRFWNIEPISTKLGVNVTISKETQLLYYLISYSEV